METVRRDQHPRALTRSPTCWRASSARHRPVPGPRHVAGPQGVAAVGADRDSARTTCGTASPKACAKLGTRTAENSVRRPATSLAPRGTFQGEVLPRRDCRGAHRRRNPGPTPTPAPARGQPERDLLAQLLDMREKRGRTDHQSGPGRCTDQLRRRRRFLRPGDRPRAIEPSRVRRPYRPRARGGW